MGSGRNQNNNQNKTSNLNCCRFNNRRNKNNSNSKNNSGANQLPNDKIREHKFRMHDSAQRKTSESYNKIVDVIVIKIQ